MRIEIYNGERLVFQGNDKTVTLSRGEREMVFSTLVWALGQFGELVVKDDKPGCGALGVGVHGDPKFDRHMGHLKKEPTRPKGKPKLELVQGGKVDG